ncbi:MAG TPA: DUF3617 family protein [Polyangia bacterium]|nr:DUF3617 family protein [Polyangia bacterium]
MKTRAAVVIALAGLAGAAWAGGRMKPGKYEIVMSREMNGQKMPPRTETKCMTEKDGDPKDLVKKMQRDPSCQMSNLVESGNKISFDMTCPKDGGKGHGEIVIAGDELTMTVTMDMKSPSGTQMSFATNVHSKRVGDCP